MLGGGFLVAIFTALFVAPLVLGGFILAQNARPTVIMGWFGLAIACFVLILIAAAAFLLTVPV
jgi:hypothetical protein